MHMQLDEDYHYGTQPSKDTDSCSCIRTTNNTATTNTSHRHVIVFLTGPPASGKTTQANRICSRAQHNNTNASSSPSSPILEKIDMGQLLREEVKDSKSELGRRIKPFLDSGKLKSMPTELPVSVLKKKLQSMQAPATTTATTTPTSDSRNSNNKNSRTDGWLFYRGPASVDEARLLHEKENIMPDVFVVLRASDDDLVDRVKYRRIDPKTGATYNLKHNPPQDETIRKRLVERLGDSEDVFRKRLQRFYASTNPILEYYNKEAAANSNKDGDSTSRVVVYIDAGNNRTKDQVYEDIKAAIARTLEERTVRKA